MPALSSWTEERTETLTRLLSEHRSAAEVAAYFGDITRNAVIGKCHRLGLSLPSPHLRGRPKTARVLAKPILPTELPTELPTISPARVLRPVTLSPAMRRLTLLELAPDQCRFPIEEGLYCGADTPKGFSYCDFHHKLTHMNREKKPNGGLTFTRYF